MIEKLQCFGLNGYEARVYTVLVEEGTIGAYTIAKKSGVPTGKIYPVLEALAAKGFVKILSSKPKMFQSVAPEVVLGNVVDEKEKKIKCLRQEIKKVVQGLRSISNVKSISKQEGVEVYLGHAAAFRRSITLHEQATRSWNTLSTLTINKAHLEICREAVLRGVQIRALTSLKETNKERIELWKQQRIQVRVLEELPFRASIYDEQGVILRFTDEQSKQYVGVHIKNEKLAKGMNKIFFNLWKNAREI